MNEDWLATAIVDVQEELAEIISMESDVQRIMQFTPWPLTILHKYTLRKLEQERVRLIRERDSYYNMRHELQLRTYQDTH